MQNIVLEIQQYTLREKDITRIPKQALKYWAKWRRNTELPKERWKDQLHLEG